MSTKTCCDGCGRELYESGHYAEAKAERVIHGERVNDLRGGGLPDHPFDWCGDCAKIAFDAVREYVRSLFSGGLPR